MALYMDIHRGMNVSAETVRQAHLSDLEAQARHGVRYLKYWFDQERGTVCCLLEAPNAEAANACHREAHGLVADKIISVESQLIESFFGGGNVDDIGCSMTNDGMLDGGFRTIMFTDIEGSSAMTEELGDDGAVRMLEIHNRITRDTLVANKGREVKHTGDGVMAAFMEVTVAVRCAIELQTAFTEHCRENPDDSIRIRIGMSAGEPVQANMDLYGVTVNLARRVCDAGDADQILVSSAVRDLCMGKGFDFSERGESTFKGFSEPIRLYEVRWS